MRRIATIEEQLILHEGLKLKPYRCTAGKLTIGVGRNLDDKGISKEEALFLLRNDIATVTTQLQKYDWYISTDPVRRKVLIDMAVNLGVGGLLKFRKMIAALERGDYEGAADQMLDSRWAEQVGYRAVRLAEMMRSGEDYVD